MLRQSFVDALHRHGVDPAQLALVAIGGFGREELSPQSDLDVVLLHDPGADPAAVQVVAQAVWQPVWDRRLRLDHAVRDTTLMRATALRDHRAAMGMLDARPVAGNGALAADLRSHVLADWRREAPRRVVELRDARARRLAQSGLLAHAAVPDLKNSGGGLRDTVTLRALVATWLIDVPQSRLAGLHGELLDVRDLLHTVTGRRSDKLTAELVPDLAEAWAMTPADFDVAVRDIGRRVSHLSRLAWRRVEQAIDADPYRRVGERGPVAELAGDGVGVLDGEVIVAGDRDVAREPQLALRAAAAAARARLPINQGTLDRLATALPERVARFDAAAHRELVDLVTAGEGLVDVWEQLDFAGLVDVVLPEWRGIRLRGSSSPVHRFTVDRHSLVACAHAATLSRDVARPDLLAVGALLHDIGKGLPGDHSEVGAPLAREIARRWRFDDAECDTIARLVRWHLLLPSIATGRDLDDPLTAANVAEIVGDEDFLDLLVALTECDATATSDAAWSGWRRALILTLVAQVRDELAGRPRQVARTEWPEDVAPAAHGEFDGAGLRLAIHAHHDGARITVVSANRVGTFAAIAGSLASLGLQIRSARTHTVGDAAVSQWEVDRPDHDESVLRRRLETVLAGEFDLDTRLSGSRARGDRDAAVRVLDAMEQSATLLEVRTADRRGLIWSVGRVISALGHDIRSIHASTYGEEARDVFYLTHRGEVLDEGAADEVRRAVLGALASG